MAPRKRTAKPPKNDPRVAKSQALLHDFDTEVTTILQQLKERTDNLLKSMDNSYEMAIIKLPKAVRKLSWMENFSLQKLQLPLVDDRKGEEEEEAAKVESVLSLEHGICPTRGNKSNKKNIIIFLLLLTGSKNESDAQTSTEDGNSSSQNTIKKVRTTKKPPTTSKKAKDLSVRKRKSSIRRSNRKALVTPAKNTVNTSLLIGSTPLVTPRFDPRLPKTPAVRNPHHKERVYSISVNGSPIADRNGDVIINVPIGNGESIQLLASQIDSADLSSLDKKALASMQQLQKRLATLCGTTK
ncbi:borealin [Lampris incognitus]|uniref:borealin n=1 Tax=Lampris incognitus TaxID=2546036 RepID=UPI0024B57CB3|nr:borealin [Lampris incognitus]